MGLDITVLGKPLPGQEAEFHDLLIALSVDAGVMADPRPAPRRSLLQRLAGQGAKALTAHERDVRMKRFQAIQTPPYAVLGAPCVGTDPQAGGWLRAQAIAAGRSESDADAAVVQAAGLYVLALLPPCDGLPVYCNAGFGTVDETSFRGAFVGDCTDILSEGERMEVWGVMTASELLDYGMRLQPLAARYAKEQGLTAQLGQRIVDWTTDGEPSAQLHIVDSLSRWAIFWGSRGHGCYPDF